MNLDEAAQSAVDKHRRLLLHKVMELSLGDLVALDGVRETRRLLLAYLVHLRQY